MYTVKTELSSWSWGHLNWIELFWTLTFQRNLNPNSSGILLFNLCLIYLNCCRRTRAACPRWATDDDSCYTSKDFQDSQRGRDGPRMLDFHLQERKILTLKIQNLNKIQWNSAIDLWTLYNYFNVSPEFVFLFQRRSESLMSCGELTLRREEKLKHFNSVFTELSRRRFKFVVRDVSFFLTWRITECGRMQSCE